MKGYVYIMINPSYQDFVKIGRTNKNPDERARELSSSTGVATPFILVYKREFSDCVLAEKTIHDILEERGCRVNNAREFFRISIPDAIELIMNLPDTSSSFDYIVEDEIESIENLAQTYYDKAEDYYYGLNDTFEDKENALYYYEKSAELGCIKAYRQIGKIWKEKGNVYKAVRVFQEGGKNRDFCCYAELGNIYMDRLNEQYYHKKNGDLAWSKFFDYANQIFKDDITIEIKDVVYYIFYFLFDATNYQQEINSLNEHVIYKYKTHLISYGQNLKNMFDDKSYSYCIDKVLSYLEDLSETILLSEKDRVILSENYQTLAKKYIKGTDQFPVNHIKALNLLKKSVELGNKKSYVDIGVCWLFKNNIAKTNKSWRNYYNYVYDILETDDVVDEELKNNLLNEFYTLFYSAINKDTNSLIMTTILLQL